MATVVALKAARDAHCDFTTRKHGVASQPKPMVGYCAAGTHSCTRCIITRGVFRLAC